MADRATEYANSIGFNTASQAIAEIGAIAFKKGFKAYKEKVIKPKRERNYYEPFVIPEQPKDEPNVVKGVEYKEIIYGHNVYHIYDDGKLINATTGKRQYGYKRKTNLVYQLCCKRSGLVKKCMATRLVYFYFREHNVESMDDLGNIYTYDGNNFNLWKNNLYHSRRNRNKK